MYPHIAHHEFFAHELIAHRDILADLSLSS